MNEQTIEEIAAQVTGFVIKAYSPDTTRWNRKHTETAEWYWICRVNERTKLL